MKKTLFCLLILTCLALSAQMNGEPGMCDKKAQALLDKVLEVWNKGNLALIPELFSADCIATSSSTPVPFVGHQGIKQWIESSRAMMPDLVMTFPEIIAKPDKIAAVWTMTGTQTGPMATPGGMMPGTGRKINVTGLSIDYVKDGKITKEVVIFNALEMLLQLGFTLAPPQPQPQG